MSEKRDSRPSLRTVLRDVTTFVLGWVLLFQQALFVDPSKVNEIFVIVAAALVGVPIGAEGLSRVTARSTVPLPSASPPDPSSSASSS